MLAESLDKFIKIDSILVLFPIHLWAFYWKISYITNKRILYSNERVSMRYLQKCLQGLFLKRFTTIRNISRWIHRSIITMIVNNFQLKQLTRVVLPLSSMLRNTYQSWNWTVPKQNKRWFSSCMERMVQFGLPC